MDIRTLQYFLAVAREKNITRAAQTLHMTQPPLSRQMRELEEELGKQLFIRGSRTISLTDEGMILRRRAEEILSLLEITRTEISDADGQISGDISIGAGETEGMRCIARAIHQLHKKYPGIHFHLSSGHADDMSAQMDQGRLDFSVVIEPVTIQKYSYLKLPQTDVWGLLMRIDHPLASKKAIHREDLIGLPLFFTSQTLADNEFSGWMGDRFSQLQIIGTYDLIFNTSLLVEEGAGCALCLDEIIRPERSGILTFRPLEPPLRAGVYLIWKKHEVLSPAASIFLETLRSMISLEPEGWSSKTP